MRVEGPCWTTGLWPLSLRVKGAAGKEICTSLAQLLGSYRAQLPRSPPLPGAPPSQAPLHAIKLEVEDVVLLGSTEPGHRQCGCSHRGPVAVISCHREEGLAKLDTRAQVNQQTPKGQ